MRASRYLTSRPYRYEYRRWAVWDRGGGPEDAVFIAGSGRSGTTWVEEIANADHSARIVFEPFRVKEVPQVRSLPEHTYLRPDDVRYVDLVRAVLSGHPRHNRWINHQNVAHVTRRRIVKEIRAHGWLGWMRHHFPETPLIFLIRHPVMVVASQQRMDWSDHLDRLLEQRDLVDDHLRPHLSLLESLETPWQRMVGHWCVDNLVAFRTVGAGLGTLVMYEEFVTDPDTASTPLLRALGRTMDPATLAEAVARPSKMARHDSAVRHGKDSLRDPFSRVPEAQRREALEIVAAMGFGDVYGNDPLPDFDAARRLWGRRPSQASATE